MKTLRNLSKILSVALIFTVVLAFASCDLLTGSLKLESFTVDRSSVKTVYYVGDEIDFSGIKATVKYSDASLNTEYTAADLTVTYDEDITETVGPKTVTVSFEDPHLNVKQSTTVQITVREDPNAVKHDSYVVDTTDMKTEYIVGETVVFDGIRVIEKFTNGGADVEVTDLSKLAYNYDAATITATAGTKTIPVTYDGESAGAISITVKKPAITSATLNTTGLTLDYNVGDTVSFTGLTASVTYENNTSAVVDAIEILTDLDTVTDTYGTKTVNVRINDATSGTTRDLSFEIRVDGVVDYTMNTENVDVTYLEGETVNFEGIVVVADYYFRADETVAFEDITFVYDSSITATPGNKTVTVKVGEDVVGDFIVVVGDIPTATANTEGVDLSYRVGETVSLDGLTVTLKYTDGTPDATLNLSDLTVVTDLATLTATAGTKTVTVKYVFNGYDVFATVTLTVYGVDHYTVDATDMKTDYIVGDTLNYTGLVVKAHYLDGGEPVVIDAAKITFSDEGITATAGPKTIVVLVDGKNANASISVTVEKNAITSAVIGGSYDTIYEVGESVNFTGITVTVTYKNGSVVTLTYADLTIGAVDMSAAGYKTVTVKFNDEINDVEENVSFTINVVKKQTVAEFGQSEELNDFASDNKTDGKYSYGETGFSGQFLNGGKLYVIGDDNEFKMVPDFAIEKEDGSDQYQTAFYSEVDIYLYVDGAYVLLEKSAITPTEYNYVLGGEVIARVDTYHGEYKFEKPLERVKISVLPSSDYYTGTAELNPVELEAKVIDAYNVHESWQLAVLDNDPSREDWNAFKTEKGIFGYDPAGIVLHADLHISASDVPASFFNVSTKEVVYTNAVTGATSTARVGTRYLIDGTVVYSRQGAAEFVIEGNFFTVDTKNFPLVASPAVFDASLELDYGEDYSNAVFIAFELYDHNWTAKPADIPYITIQNVALIGNAARDNWQDAEQNLVTAGGLIMVRSSRWANTTLNNVINNSFFISYFTDYEGTMIVNDSKCYDSYQNGAFVWADSVLKIDGSYINGTGGPVIIAQSVDPDSQEGDTHFNPVCEVTNTKVETHLSGTEIWFDAVGATTLIGNIQALGAGLAQAGLGNWVDAGGKMNIKAILMRNGETADEALSDIHVQGTVSFEGTGIDRWWTSQPWGTIYETFKVMPELAAAPILTAYGADGTPYTIYFDGKTFRNLQDQAVLDPENESQAALLYTFGTANQVVLSQGGLSVVFEFYHGANAYIPPSN